MNTNSLEEKRERMKFYLGTFMEELQFNSYMNALEEKIKNDIINLDKIISDHYEAEQDLQSSLVLNTDAYEDKLLALCEMNIIFIYKEWEITLKRLLCLAYGNTDRNLYKWEYLKTFLKSKNINIWKIKCCQEIDQIRIVNNNIKHSKGLDDNDLRTIKEFSSLKFKNYRPYLEFYERIKNSTFTFLHHLADLIYSDLFVFDNERLDVLASSYVERMDKEVAEKFASILINKY